MPTIQQLVRKGRQKLIDKSKSPALDSHLFDNSLIRALDDGGMIQIAFSLLALLGQNVAMIGMLPFDSAGTRQFKTFFGTGL